MKAKDIEQIVNDQRAFFNTGQTLDIDYRIKYLKKLKATIKANEPLIYQALASDLNKSETESYMCEIGMVYSELSYMLKHIHRFTKKQSVHTPLAQAIAKSYILPSPLGVVLVMSPWNYPFMLSIEPMIDALAAGNTIIIKPSAYAPHVAEIVKTIIEATFPANLVTTITGGREENQALLQQNFDHIFFTGSKNVGREVMSQASKHLTPITLELGGKSPCIVTENANIKMAAKRIVFGKFLNAGQTCVAPDYVVCHESQIKPLLEQLQKEIIVQLTENPLDNPNYTKIINDKHYQRLTGLLAKSQIYWGGQLNPSHLQIAPTIIYPCTKDAAIMEEEIFGPLLPVLTYSNLEELIDQINKWPTPLALYIFSEDQQEVDVVLKKTHFGGAAVNDTLTHLATSNMGFGGLKESGMGAYHGKTGFDTFTHYKSIIDKKTWVDLPIRYQPYSNLKDKLIKFFLK